MNRRLRKFGVLVLLLLAGGAIVNVAVAWGCAAYIKRSITEDYYLDRIDLDPDLARLWPSGFPKYHPFIVKRSAIGTSEVFVSAGEASRGFLTYCIAGIPVSCFEGFGTASPSNSMWSSSSLAYVRILSKRVGPIPLEPIWPGFAINTIFYAAILALLLYAPRKVRRFVRVRRGRCPACAYPVGSSPVCTECGAPLVRTRK
jgi:hypothetical protein